MSLDVRRFGIALALSAIASSLAAPLLAQSTPAAALKAYYDAGKKQDVAAFKRIVSSAYLEQLAKAPVPPERIVETLARHLPARLPGFRNESITGDRATLEVHDHASNKWETLHFVREDGVWKVALEKMK